MPKTRLGRVKRLEDSRRALVGYRLDVTMMTDFQLEDVIGIPGLSAAMDRMGPADTTRVVSLLSEATNDAIAECREIVVHAGDSECYSETSEKLGVPYVSDLRK